MQHRARRFAIRLSIVLAAASVAVVAGVTYAAAATTRDNSTIPLWEVTSPYRTMYITGAIGASLKKYPVPAAILRAFARSDELVMEGKITVEPKEKIALVKKYGLQPSGKTLSDDLGAADLKIVGQALAKYRGYALAKLQPFRPWMVVMALNQAEGKASKLQIKPHQLYALLQSEAEKRFMPISYLNTIAGEFKLYAGVPEPEWLMMKATNALKPGHAEERASQHIAGVEAWRRGDVRTVAKIIARSYRGYPSVYRALVTDYEPRWDDVLKADLRTRGKTVFVIVNAGNLVGPVNILASLRKDGYQVVQL